MRIQELNPWEQVELLQNIGLALSAEKDNDRLLEMIVSQARLLTRADAGSLFLRDENTLVFKILQNESLEIFSGGQGEKIDLPPVPLNATNVSAAAALERRIINVPDVYGEKGFDFSGPRRYDAMTGYRTQSMLVVPLVNHEDVIIGVLQLINARDEEGQFIPFDSRYEKVIASLASQAAISLTKERFIADIKRLFQSFVEVMATAVDARTPYNVNHTRRVARMSEDLAQAVHRREDPFWQRETFAEDRLKQLIMAAWLHDIGKLAIPLSVMDKATRLGAGLELIMVRLDYIAATDQGEVEEARSLIQKANDPGTVVDSHMGKAILSLEQRHYIDGQGNLKPWLTRTEGEALSVIRGTLTRGERELMMSHVEVTRRILDKIPFIHSLQHVPAWAALHHEYLDGTGYPQGLQGEEIPLEGRILALVDVFDALTAADRPYKKAIPREQALDMMKDMVREGKLDGKLFNVFVEERIWNAPGEREEG